MTDSRDPNVIVVTTAKNEGRFLLEWLAFHRLIGVKNFLIYTNDCEDDSPVLLDRLTELGIVIHQPNPIEPGEFPHLKASTRARTHPLVTEAEYVLLIDPDEFLVIKTGRNCISDLLATAPGADVICIQMRFFGDNGLSRLPRGLVIENFTAASFEYFPPNRRMKSLAKNSDVLSNITKNHQPGFNADRLPRIFNCAGMEVPPDVFGHERFLDMPNDYRSMKYAQLNHYAVKTFDYFRAKKMRGPAQRGFGKFHMGYWNKRNRNELRDTTILRDVPRVKALIEEWLQDPQLAASNKRCFEAYDDILKQAEDVEIDDAATENYRKRGH
jgi:hypothetical protein